jgi:intracellular sulfur oxidation DsrE/DsrF family protein
MRQDMLRRRGLFAALGAVAGALAVGTRRVAAQAASTFQPVRHAQDDWLDKVPGKHRIVLDVTSAAGVTDALRFVGNIYEGHRTGYGVEQSDLAVVVVLRHTATAFAYGDDLWGKHGKSLAESTSYSNPGATEPPKTNPYNTAPGNALGGLAKRGVQFMVCGTASRGISRRLAGDGGDAEALYKAMIANMIPSSRIVPAGVISITRAQEYGYGVVHVG